MYCCLDFIILCFNVQVRNLGQASKASFENCFHLEALRDISLLFELCIFV